MKLGYYPGCTLKSHARNLEDAAIGALSVFGVEVIELERWNCCGAVYSLADDDLIHLLAPVRDLIRAKDMGFDKLMTLCSMCYNTLARANLLMREDEEKRYTINTFMEEETDYEGEVEVVHLLNFLRDDIGWDEVKKAVKKPLDSLKLAPYYGCTLTRPHEVTIDNGVSPSIFGDLVEALGASCVDFDHAEECCSSYQMISNPDAGIQTAAGIIASAESREVDALIMSCPLCEYNLGRRQNDIIAKNEALKPLPVFYFTQLLALALGVDDNSCGFDLNLPASRELLKEKELVQ
ncbi:heterodisulfide reductase, subunit B [candidate division LCP-89 bacterium B3_LCP]|uniref:Heterodisulfide reductase, subunit B n=1 Tax=candidate division LCP-89 bacterium B3_LCP TaxID=2012998 RepID=A0A532V1I1_UNCL8|nr:MAG: heterodisulfide reductase, subunit B [candidate division LCP-89 bacterium B3_LCP]